MLPHRVSIGTVEETQKTTKTINLEKAGGRRELNALGMLPLSSIRAITLLMTSATSSLALSLHKMFLSSQLSYHGAFPNTKRSQRCDFFFFFFYPSHDTCSYSYGASFISRFILKTVGCWSRHYGIYQLVSPRPKLFMYLTFSSATGIGKAALIRLIGRLHSISLVYLSAFYNFQFNSRNLPHVCLSSLSALSHSHCTHCQLCEG